MILKHEDRLSAYIKTIDDALGKYIPSVQSLPQAKLIEAMQYSLFAGGKRLRPVLLLEFCRLSGGNVKHAVPFACALEMIHAYSLIHDDLPCMDDDTERRGRPCNHVVYGEATALLAGDALLTAAFETMLDPDYTEGVDPACALRAAHCIALSAGAFGMAGGQQLDMEGLTGLDDPFESAITIHTLKTGAIIAAAAEVGCILGGANEEQIRHATSFAKALGIAFQIKDDILNVEGNAAETGKSVGSDAAQDKLTFVRLKGLDECKSLVLSATRDAIGFLYPFAETLKPDHDDSDRAVSFLTWLANEMVNRRA